MTRRHVTERPEWCGMCDETSRLVDRGDGVAARCARCHAACQPGGRHAPRRPSGSARLDLALGQDK